MIFWCSYCQRFMREEAPFEDLSVSHALCDSCSSSLEDIDERVEKGARVRDFLEATMADLFERRLPSEDRLLAESRALGIRDVDLLVGLLQPVLCEVGRRFVSGRISVELEHKISALTESILQALDDAAASEPSQPCMLLVSAPGNTHTIGPRIYAAQEAEKGEDCDIMLAAAPEQVLARLESGGYRRLGISVALPSQCEAARNLADLARERQPDIEVVIGGYAVKTATASPAAAEA
ncbi:MAG: cobalamin B12-binding domain-containing protein [Woeseiaceae bacterium]|nr:cobalamin B12-binding domain-containing protein [Woeseiaceae bacterium]